MRVGFTDDAGNEESLTSYAVIVSRPLVVPDEEVANTPATGAPRHRRLAGGRAVPDRDHVGHRGRRRVDRRHPSATSGWPTIRR